ncbi:MAG: hypothetical protein ACM3JG_05605 [Thiohalocapsa sp.]
MIREAAGYRHDDRVVFGFIGPSHPSNVAGVLSLLEVLCAVIGESFAPIELVFAGPICEAIGEFDSRIRMTRLGRIEDENAFYDRIDFCIVPVFDGAGFNVNACDILQRRQPALFARHAAEGLALDQSLLVGDAGAMADAMSRLAFERPPLAPYIRCADMAWHELNHRIGSATERLFQAFQAIGAASLTKSVAQRTGVRGDSGDVAGGRGRDENEAGLSLDERARALMSQLQQIGLGLGGINDYCGSEEKLGLEDVPEWQDWIDKPTTRDQTRIEDWLSRLDLIRQNILHIGVGNSSLALRLAGNVHSIFGTTIYQSEKELSETLKLPNYTVALINKFSRSMFDIAEQFDVVVDSAPGGYVCCHFHFSRMMLAYRDLLAPGGVLVTAQPGWGWIPVPGATRPRTVTKDFQPCLGWEEWVALAGALGLHAEKADEFVYTMRRGGADARPARDCLDKMGQPLYGAGRNSAGTEQAPGCLRLPENRRVAEIGRPKWPGAEQPDPSTWAGNSGTASRKSRMNEPDLSQMLQKLEHLIREATVVKQELLAIGVKPSPVVGEAEPSRPLSVLQQKLAPLIAQALAAPQSRLLAPFEEVAPGVKVGFNPGNNVSLTISPQTDAAASAPGWKNSLSLALGAAGWFSIEIHLAASELSLGERYQLALSARPSQTVPCCVVLRRVQGKSHYDRRIRDLRLHPAERNYNTSGKFDPSPPDEAGDADTLILLLFFESTVAVKLELDYLNLYFA